MTVERQPTQRQEHGLATRPEVSAAQIEEALQNPAVEAGIQGITNEGAGLVQKAETPEAGLTFALHVAEHGAAAGKGDADRARAQMLDAMEKKGLSTESLAA